MAEDKISIRPETVADDTLILDFHGPLAGDSAPALEQALAGTGKIRSILLNLENLTHLDAEGAMLLIAGAARLARQRIGLAACGLGEALRDVFRLTELDDALTVFPTRQAALDWRPFPVGGQATGHAPADGRGPLLPGWAASVAQAVISDVPAAAMNINVRGRKTTSPVHGFGCLWEKKYRLALKNTSLTPQEVSAVWRNEFPHFWPAGNRLFTSGGGPIVPGATALLNLDLGGPLVMATGIRVIYADASAFCFSTIRGHLLYGWINFSSFRRGDETVIQVHPLFRAADAVMEAAFRIGASEKEDRFWHQTLSSLAARLGGAGRVEQISSLVDDRVRWQEIGNVWYCGAIRSSLYMPFYLLKKIFSG